MKFIRASLGLWCLIIGTLVSVGCATCHHAPKPESDSEEQDGLRRALDEVLGDESMVPSGEHR